MISPGLFCPQVFDVTLVAPSGFLNAAWAVSGATYNRLRDEAARAVTYLDDPDVDSFQVCRGGAATDRLGRRFLALVEVAVC